MMSMNELHTSIRKIVPPEHLVIGVSKQLIVDEVLADLKSLSNSSHLNGLVVKTNSSAMSVRISDIGPHSVKFVTDGEIALSFSASLQFIHPEKLLIYRSRQLIVDDATFRLLPDFTGPTGIRFSYQYGEDAIKVWPATEGPTKEAIDEIFKGREQDYLAEEAVLADRATDAVVNLLLASFYVPALKGALERFKLGMDLYLEAGHPEFILLHGSAEVSKNGCPYAPRNEASSPWLEERIVSSALTPCKEISNNDFRLELLVLYPSSSTFAVLAGGVSLGIQYDDYANDTISFWQYNIAAVLTRLEVSFDLSQLRLSLDSTWNLAGSGSTGLRISCVNHNVSLVTAGLDQGSSVNVNASAQPCLDDDTVYLKTTRGGASNINIHFQNSIAGPVLQNALDAALKGPLNDILSKALADSMQVPLFKLSGWYGQSGRPRYQFWTQSIMAHSLLIALPRPPRPYAINDEPQASKTALP